jgi:acyl carrier protein
MDRRRGRSVPNTHEEAVMSVQSTAALDELIQLIYEVKPGLVGTEVRSEDSLVDTLGLDSLDILQLSRKVNRDIGSFDFDEWVEKAKGHRTVGSILEAVETSA